MYAQFLTFEYLKKEYLDNKRGCSDIAKEIGCSPTLILNYLKKFGIKRRSRLEAISKRIKEKQKKSTQTVEQYLDKLAKVNKALEELKELEELIKALRGEESNYYVNPSDIEQNRLKADGEAKKRRYQQFLEDEEYEKRRGGGGKWHVGDVNDQLYDILDLLDERI